MAIRRPNDKSLPYRKTRSTEISLMKRVDKLNGESSTLITLVSNWQKKILLLIPILAICSPNCIQIWKGRDRNTVFFRVRHKKCRAKGETFFVSNPVKKYVLIETFLYENKILTTHNFFCRKLHFFKSKRTGKLLFTALDSRVRLKKFFFHA